MVQGAMEKNSGKITVDIDPRAGFCFGVTKVVDTAEEILRKEGHLYCLGEIVHNVKEIERLEKLGLRIITREEFLHLSNCKVLVRAHGEPPETYVHALKNNIGIIDGTCPIVLKLQSRIEADFTENELHGAQIVIYGKKDHAEVRGLAGQTVTHRWEYQGKTIVESEQDLDRIDYTRPIHLYAQTTMNRDSYNEIVEKIHARATQSGMDSNMIRCTNSICGQVSGRIPRLKSFCEDHDVIIFASSLQSSNGKLLFRQCKQLNERTYFVSEVSDLKDEWLMAATSVGVTGATSTPRWFLEEIATFIQKR